MAYVSTTDGGSSILTSRHESFYRDTHELWQPDRHSRAVWPGRIDALCSDGYHTIHAMGEHHAVGGANFSAADLVKRVRNAVGTSIARDVNK